MQPNRNHANAGIPNAKLTLLAAAREARPSAPVRATERGVTVAGHTIRGPDARKLEALLRSGEPLTGETLRWLLVTGLLRRARLKEDAGDCEHLAFYDREGHALHGRSVMDLVRVEVEADYEAAATKGDAYVFVDEHQRTKAALEGGQTCPVDRLLAPLVEVGNVYRAFAQERPAQPWLDRRGREHTTRLLLVPLPGEPDRVPSPETAEALRRQVEQRGRSEAGARHRRSQLARLREGATVTLGHIGACS